MKSILAAAALALAATVPLTASADSGFHAAYSGSGYERAATCDLTQPIAFITLAMSNTEPQLVPQFTITATDPYGALHGTVDVPALRGGDTRAVRVPLRYTYVPRNPQQASGAYTMTVTVFDRTLPQLTVVIPSSFCPPGPPPTFSPATKSGSPASRAVPRQPLGDERAVAIDRKAGDRAGTIVAAVNLGSPSNLHAVAGGQECAAHVGTIGALVCPDMIKSGNLLLAWEWHGADAIDGYRVYRVDGGLRQLVSTQANKKDVTLADLAKPAGGYAGKCYAVTAYAGARESAASDAYCAEGGAVAKTVQLQPSHVRSVQRFRGDTGNALTGEYGVAPLSGSLVVGFTYQETKHTLGDSRHNAISRAAVSFELGTLLVRRFVSARLKLHVVTSDGPDPKHSCATGVGSGTAAWWQNKDWIEVNAAGSVAPTDSAPQVTADVSPIVAAWLRGEANFGLVLWNEDENLGAFTNKQCETAYDNPVLEVTYY